MRSVRVPVIAALLAAVIVYSGYAVDPPKPKPGLPVVKLKPTKWIPLFEAATLQARKEKKIILAYFSGSDWEPFTQKLEKDVLNTEMFQKWATDHVILFQVDFPRDKKLSTNIKSQNDRLKQRYSIIKVPTFILMDYSGMPFARASFDEAKLRDEEVKGEPRAWIKYLEDTIKNRPPDEEIIKQPTMTDCLKYAKKHFISAVLLINQGRVDRSMQAKDDLVHNQQFVRFMNRNVAYAEIDWPYDSDTSAEAAAFRAFATAQGISPTALQLVVWDMQTKKVNFRLTAVDPARADNIVAMVESKLPKIDYNNGWIEDFRMANAIAQQQKRFIFLCFTSMDSSEFSKKIDEEIFQSDDFVAYARKHLVTVRIDFPTATTQPVTLVSQNKTLAEMFAVRGYPTIIVLNPQGQKIADAKYMKGGPGPFMKQLEAAIKSDEDRRAFLAGEQ